MCDGVYIVPALLNDVKVKCLKTVSASDFKSLEAL